jgi:hypothetical protein
MHFEVPYESEEYLAARADLKRWRKAYWDRILSAPVPKPEQKLRKWGDNAIEQFPPTIEPRGIPRPDDVKGRDPLGCKKPRRRR